MLKVIAGRTSVFQSFPSIEFRKDKDFWFDLKRFPDQWKEVASKYLLPDKFIGILLFTDSDVGKSYIVHPKLIAQGPFVAARRFWEVLGSVDSNVNPMIKLVLFDFVFSFKPVSDALRKIYKLDIKDQDQKTQVNNLFAGATETMKNFLNRNVKPSPYINGSLTFKSVERIDLGRFPEELKPELQKLFDSSLAFRFINDSDMVEVHPNFKNDLPLQRAQELFRTIPKHNPEAIVCFFSSLFSSNFLIRCESFGNFYEDPGCENRSEKLKETFEFLQYICTTDIEMLNQVDSIFEKTKFLKIISGSLLDLIYSFRQYQLSELEAERAIICDELVQCRDADQMKELRNEKQCVELEYSRVAVEMELQSEDSSFRVNKRDRGNFKDFCLLLLNVGDDRNLLNRLERIVFERFKTNVAGAVYQLPACRPIVAKRHSWSSVFDDAQTLMGFDAFDTKLRATFVKIVLEWLGALKPLDSLFEACQETIADFVNQNLGNLLSDSRETRRRLPEMVEPARFQPMVEMAVDIRNDDSSTVAGKARKKRKKPENRYENAGPSPKRPKVSSDKPINASNASDTDELTTEFESDEFRPEDGISLADLAKKRGNVDLDWIIPEGETQPCVRVSFPGNDGEVDLYEYPVLYVAVRSLDKMINDPFKPGERILGIELFRRCLLDGKTDPNCTTYLLDSDGKRVKPENNPQWHVMFELLSDPNDPIATHNVERDPDYFVRFEPQVEAIRLLLGHPKIDLFAISWFKDLDFLRFAAFQGADEALFVLLEYFKTKKALGADLSEFLNPNDGGLNLIDLAQKMDSCRKLVPHIKELIDLKKIRRST